MNCFYLAVHLLGYWYLFVAAQLRFTSEPQHVVIDENQGYRFDPIILASLDSADYSSDDPVRLVISCEHGSLSVDQNTIDKLITTSFVCSDSSDVTLPQRSLTAYTKITEAQQLLSALTYTPDANYHSDWANAANPTFSSVVQGHGRVLFTLERIEPIALREVPDTCDRQLFSSEAIIHEVEIFMHSINSAPSIMLTSHRDLVVVQGECTSLPELQLSDPDGILLENESDFFVPVMTLQLQIENEGHILLNQREGLINGVRIVNQSIDLENPEVSATFVELDGTIGGFMTFVSAIRYCTSLHSSSAKAGLRVTLSDNGFYGVKIAEPLSASVSIPIQIIPLLDVGSIEGNMQAESEVIKLQNASVRLDVQYIPGNIDQVYAEVQLQHDDGTLVGIEDYFGIMAPNDPITTYTQQLTVIDVSHQMSLLPGLTSQLLHLSTGFQKEVQTLAARLDEGESFDKFTITLALTYADVISTVAVDLSPALESDRNLQDALNALSNAGRVKVSRGTSEWSKGLLWVITFETLSGPNIPLLDVNILSFPGQWSGQGSKISVQRLAEGTVRPQIDQLILSADSPLVLGEFALRIVNPPALRGVTQKISFDALSTDLEAALEETTGLDQVEVTLSAGPEGERIWLITFLTDTALGENSKVVIVPMWNHVDHPYGASYCKSCSAFSSPATGIDQLQHSTIDQGSVGLSGVFQLHFGYLNTTYEADISADSPISKIQSMLQHQLPLPLARSFDLSVLACEDPQLACSWKIVVDDDTTAWATFDVSRNTLRGSGLVVDITEDNTRFMGVIQLKSKHSTWTSERTASLPYRFTEKQLKHTVSVLTDLNCEAHCSSDRHQQICVIEYTTKLEHIPTVYLDAFPPMNRATISSLQRKNDRYPPRNMLIIEFGEEISDSEAKFQLIRTACASVNECYSLISPILHQGSSDIEIGRAINAIATHGESIHHTRVMRYSESRAWHIWNLPGSLVHAVEIISEAQTLIRKASPSLVLQGDKSAVAATLSTLSLYSPGISSWSQNQLKVIIRQAEIDIETYTDNLEARLALNIVSTYVDVRLVVNDQLITKKDEFLFLDSVSIVHPLVTQVSVADRSYADGSMKEIMLHWRVRSEFVNIHWQYNPRASSLKIRQPSNHELELQGTLGDLATAMSTIYLESSSLWGKVNHSLPVVDTLQLSVYTLQDHRLLDFATIDVHVVNQKESLSISLGMSFLRANVSQPLLVDGIMLYGYGNEVKLVVLCSKGKLSLIPRDQNPMEITQFHPNGALEQHYEELHLEGSMLELNHRLKSHHLVYTPDLEASGYDELSIHLRGLDVKAQEVLPIEIIFPVTPPMLSLSAKSMTVFQNEEVEIHGITLSIPTNSYPSNYCCSTLDSVISVYLETGLGYLTLSPSMAHITRLHSVSKEVKMVWELRGTPLIVNMALDALRYRYVNDVTPAEDTITFSVDLAHRKDHMDTSASTLSTLAIQIVRHPQPILVLFDGSTINERDFLVTPEDTAQSLRNITIRMGNGETQEANILLYISLRAEHGLFLSGTKRSSANSSGNQMVHFTGTVAQTNAFLHALEYQPERNFNGPDQILVTVEEILESQVDDDILLEETTAILPVFVTPIPDPPRLTWVGSDSNFLSMTMPALSEMSLPALHIEKDEDVGFFQDDKGFRMVIHTTSGSVFHDTVQGRQKQEGGSELVLIGTVRDLSHSFSSVKYRCDAPRLTSANITIRVNAAASPTTDDVFSSAMVHLKYENLTDKTEFILIQNALTTLEDADVLIGHLCDLRRADGFDNGVLGSVTAIAQHGVLYIMHEDIKTTLLLNRSLTIVAPDFQSQRRLLLLLRYVPNPNFNGVDRVDFEHHGKTNSLHIHVEPVNDPPKVDVSTQEWEQQVNQLKIFLPRLHILDPDEDDPFRVEIEATKGFLRVENPSDPRFDGITVAITRNSTFIRFMSSLSLLNHLFAQTTVRILPKVLDQSVYATHEATITICVNDGTDTACHKLFLPFRTRFYSIILREQAKISAIMGSGSSLDLSGAFHVDAQKGSHEIPLVLRIDAQFGDISVSPQDCANFYEANQPSEVDDHRAGTTIMVYARDIDCLNLFLSSIVFKSDDAYPAPNNATITLELFDDEMQWQAAASLDITVVASEPPYRLSVRNLSETATLYWRQNERKSLSSLLAINISNNDDGREDKEASKEAPILELNVTCLRCQWIYEALIPGVSYGFAALHDSSLQFLGKCDDLMPVVHSLEMALDPKISNNMEEMIVISISSVSSEDIRNHHKWNDMASVSFYYVLELTPLHWKIYRNDMIADGVDNTVRLHGVEVQGRDKELDLHLTVRFECTAGQALLSLHTPGIIRLDKPCGPDENPIEFSTTRAQINRVLAGIAVSLDTYHPVSRVNLHCTVKETENRDEARIATLLHLYYQPTLNVPNFWLKKQDQAIHLNEDEPMELGELIAIEGGYESDELLVAITANVELGSLVVPESVCCVEVQSGSSKREIIIIGTIPAVINALAATIYQPDRDASGEDILLLDVRQKYAEPSPTPLKHRVLVLIQPVNDPPIVRYQSISDPYINVSYFEQRIRIHDVDIDSHDLAVSSDLFLVNLSTSSGAFLIDRAAAHQVTILEMHEAAHGYTHLAFEATLANANKALARVLYVPRHKSSSCFDQNELLVVVNDRGHGIQGWEAQEVSTLLTVTGCITNYRNIGLGLPEEHAILDVMRRQLSLYELTIKGSDESASDEFHQSAAELLQLQTTGRLRIDLEVQRVTIHTPSQLQTMTITLATRTGSVTSTTGTLELRFDLGSSAINRYMTLHIYADAVAMITDEVLGEMNNGRSPSASIEAQFRSLFGALKLSPSINLHAVRTWAGPLTQKLIWTVYITDPPMLLPSPTISTSNLVGGPGCCDVFVDSDIATAVLDGSFRLQLHDETTEAIAFDASDMDVQDALEALSTVETAKVAKIDSVTWEITFFSPGDNIPLLRGKSDLLRPFAKISDDATSKILKGGAFVDVERILKGYGQGNLYEVTVGASAIEPVYALVTSADTTIYGEFNVGFQELNDLNSPLLSISSPITFNAVAMKRDEGISYGIGQRMGESVQNKIEQAIKRLNKRHRDVKVYVTRGPLSVVGSVEWLITFKEAPFDFPKLVVANSDNMRGENANVEITIRQSSNPVGGTFTLSYCSELTPPIPADASAESIEHILNELPSVYSDAFRLGHVVVRKARSSIAENGYRYAILFIDDITAPMINSEGIQPLLIADGSSLTGVGAYARVDSIQIRSYQGAFQFGDDRHLTEGWMKNLNFHQSVKSHSLVGYAKDMNPYVQRLTYHLPDNWCGYVQILFALSMNSSTRPGMEELLDTLASSEVGVPCSIPAVAVELTTSTDAINVTRGQTRVLEELRLICTTECRSTAWFHLKVETDNGILAVGRMTSTSADEVQWINGTVANINKQLRNVQYTSFLNDAKVDYLSTVIFDVDGANLGKSVFVLLISMPPLHPLLHIEGSIEGPFTSAHWEVWTIQAKKGEEILISGVSVGDISKSISQRNDEVVLEARTEFGELFFAQSDQITIQITHMDTSGAILTCRGEMQAINEALRWLYYKSYHLRDTISLSVYNQNTFPVAAHYRTIIIEITEVIAVPRVLLGSNTYFSGQDTAFQFPDLSLEFTKPRNASKSKFTIIQLWSATFPYLTGASDFWKLDWIFDFPNMTSASTFCAMGDYFFFRGSDSTHGEELWVSDGSNAGTRMLVDLEPGPHGSSPSGFSVLNGWLYFTASGIDLSWALDTKTCNGLRSSSVSSNVFYVVAKDNTWIPSTVYDCPPGSYWASTDDASRLFPSNIQMSATEPYVFWDSCNWDGYVFNGVSRVYFRFSDSHITGALKHAGRQDSAPVEVSFASTDFAGIVCIRNTQSEKGGSLRNTKERELWRTDGTPSHTTRVMGIRDGSKGTNPQFYTPFRSQWLIFQATTDEFGTELFKTDGSMSGTMIVEDIWRGPRSSNPSFFAEWVAGDGRMYFAATAESGRELWATDAHSSFSAERNRKTSLSNSNVASVGTFLVHDICVGSGSSDPQFLVSGSNGVFFAATDCIHGRELWITDGSIAGTRMVKDLNTATGSGSNPTDLVMYKNKLYFQAEVDSSVGRELYVSDGTEIGTKLLVDLIPGSVGSRPTHLSVIVLKREDGTMIDEDLYFTANDANERKNIWKIDDTKAEFLPVLDSIFNANHRIRFEQPVGTAGSVFHFKNAVYFFVDVEPWSAVTNHFVSHIEYQLRIHANVGSISIPSILNDEVIKDSTNSITLSDSYEGLLESLGRLVYYPPLNWNNEKSINDHVVEWTFTVSHEDKLYETYAYLLITPRADAPVVTVPSFIQYPPRSMDDFLYHQRLECSPIECDEDTPIALDGFTVRIADMQKVQPSNALALFELKMSVLHGTLTLSDTSCITQFSGQQAPNTIELRGELSCLNRIVKSLIYLSDPNFSGIDYLQIRASSFNGLSETAAIPIHVREINDAPFVISSTFYESEEDLPLVIEDIRIVDLDISEDTLVSVTMDAAFGSLALLRHDGIHMVPSAADERLSFQGTLRNINWAISSVVYTSAKDWNSLAYSLDSDIDDGFDSIKIHVTECSPFNASSTSVLFVYVIPTPDPVAIHFDGNIVSGDHVDEPSGSLHGDEDIWIITHGLSFSSPDETSHTSLQVSMSVQNGTLELSGIIGISFLDDTHNGAKSLKFRGTIANVNKSVQNLRYLPNRNFYGTDSLIITANTKDENTFQYTLDTVINIPIEIDPINDPPSWGTGYPSVLTVEKGSPILMHGVSFEDIDTLGNDCVSCEFDLILQTSHGVITLPQAEEVDIAIKTSRYILLSGTQQELNYALSELIFEIEDSDIEFLEGGNIHLMLTVDDRGTYGKGGPHVSTTTIRFSPVAWHSDKLELKAPTDVLYLDEDTFVTFDGVIQLYDSKSARHPVLLEVTITATNGNFAVRSTLGIQIVRNESNIIVLRGFLSQLNTALNGSAYFPSVNWYGSEQLTISITDETTGRTTAASIYLFVAPTCDEPQWHSTQFMDVLMLDEDSDVLVDTLSLTTADQDADRREVTISIQALHGGVMLATLKGLLVTHQVYAKIHDSKIPPADDEIFTSRLFFSELVFTGRLQDINTALRGLIFRPSTNYNSNGNTVDAIIFRATGGCDGDSFGEGRLLTIRMRVEAVNDAPILLSQPFVKILSLHSLQDLPVLVPYALEVIEDSEHSLNSVEVYDPDQETTDGSASSLRLLVNVTCVDCTIRISQMTDNEVKHDGLIFLPTDSHNHPLDRQCIVHGSPAAVNDGFLSNLIFRTRKDFHGVAFVVIMLSDLGNYGKGGPQTTTYALGVHVRGVNYRPDIHLPPYGSRQPLLRIAENSSVLLQGAPPLQVLSEKQMNQCSQTKLPRWTLMAANPYATESSIRLYNLHNFFGPDFSTTSYLLAHNGRLLFSGNDNRFGAELWHSDGSEAGTSLLKDIYPGIRGSKPAYLTPFSVDNRVYFSAEGPHLSWQIRSDYVDDCQSFRQSSFVPNVYFAVAENNMWDVDEAYNCPVGFRWMSTAEANSVFLGSNPLDDHGQEPLAYYDQCGWNGYVWGGVERKYFRFADSKASGAFKHAGYRDSYRVDTGFQTEAFAGIVCIQDKDTANFGWGRELWATDSTSEGTHRVVRISSHPQGSDPAFLTEFNNLLYFQATSPAYGAELWATDGTKAGTFFVADIEFGERGSEPRDLTVLSDQLFFSAQTQAFGRELWFSDGQPRNNFALDHSHVGTGLLLDICPGVGSSNPRSFTAMNDGSLLLFQADDCIHGPELWATDGTAAGTLLLVDINAEAAGSSPSYLTAFSNRVFFQADDGRHGPELWVTDGTQAGTFMLVDLSPGVSGSRPRYLTVLPFGPLDRIVFSAQAERDQQTEFWETDGTVAGTVKLFPGSREIGHINTLAMDQMAMPQLVNIGSPSFFYFGVGLSNSHAFHEQTNSADAQSYLRSITVEALDSSDANFPFTLSLNCSKGWLSLGRHCDGISIIKGNLTCDHVIKVSGHVDALNCAVEQVNYHSNPQETGWDNIFVMLEDDRPMDDTDDGRGYAVTKRIPIEIIAINDPPVVHLPSQYHAPQNAWVALKGIMISDPDAGNGLLYFKITVASGKLRADTKDVSNLNANDGDSNTLEFASSIASSSQIFSILEYGCFVQDKCQDSTQDYLTIYVDDNGFTGSGGPRVAMASAIISIYATGS